MEATMTNELGMKPNTARRMFADEYHTLEDLEMLIAKIKLVSNQHPSVINIEGAIELEAECLSDGSVVYNCFEIEPAKVRRPLEGASQWQPEPVGDRGIVQVTPKEYNTLGWQRRIR
jgi:hypothetical protein